MNNLQVLLKIPLNLGTTINFLIDKNVTTNQFWKMMVKSLFVFPPFAIVFYLYYELRRYLKKDASKDTDLADKIILTLAFFPFFGCLFFAYGFVSNTKKINKAIDL